MEQPMPDRDRRYTVEEYLPLDAASDVKDEYWDGLLVPHGGWETDARGRVIGTAGATARHNDVAFNLLRALGNGLGRTPCKVGTSDLRVRSPRSGRYHYPDGSITCGPRVFAPPEDEMTVANPQVIIEVLSPSTEAHDRNEKFREYIAIESLREYLLVSQDQPLVQAFHRNADGVWTVGPWAEGIDASVAFPSLGVTVPLAEVYAGVTFPRAANGVL